MRSIALILFLIAVSAGDVFAQEEEEKTDVVYSIEQTSEDDFWKIATYPCPDMSQQQLRDFIQSRVTYPPLAKKYFRGSTFTIHIQIDEKGHASIADMLTSGNPEFEDIAISILLDSNFKWKPATKFNRPKKMKIWVPVSFEIYYANEKVYFAAKFFLNFKPIILDSAITYPALLRLQNEKKYYNEFRHLVCPPAWSNEAPYGAVEIGFEVDTTGRINEKKLLGPISNALDKDALLFIDSTDGKWISARKNGVKVPSYKKFNCLFNHIYVTEDFYRIPGASGLLRRYYESDINEWEYLHYTVAYRDYSIALSLLSRKKYSAAVDKFDKATRYYINSVILFYNRAIAYYHTGNVEKACDDLQYVLTLAATEGYPLGITQKQVEAMLSKHCR